MEKSKEKQIVTAISKTFAACEKASIAIGTLEGLFAPFCDFNLYIVDVPGDGILLGNQDTANVAPVVECLRTIIDTGCLSEIDHNGLCI